MIGHLAEVQRRRERPTRIIQACQAFAQQHVVAHALRSPTPFKLPRLLRWGLQMPWLRLLPSYLIAFGGGPTNVVK